MANMAYADVMAQVKVMVDVLGSTSESLPLGVNASTIEQLSSVKAKVEALNSEQQVLKGELKAKTKDLEEHLKLLKSIYAQTKKRIKMEVEQPLWKKYGIEDKK